MRRITAGSAIVALLLLAGATVGQTEEPGRAAQTGERVMLASRPAKANLYADPYRRYFSGHYCDCWRKANVLPIDEKSMFAGVLPRADTLSWSKKKVLDMSGMSPDEMFLARVFSGLVNRRKGMWYCKESNDYWLAANRAPWKDAITGRLLKGHYQHDGRIVDQGIGNAVNREKFLEGVKRWIVEPKPGSIDGCILYDPALWDRDAKPRQPRDLLNVLRTMCAVERALPLTPRLHEALMKQLGDPAKLPVVMDTTKRQDWNLDKFHGDEKAAAYSLYAWAFNNFWKNEKNAERQCVHHTLCYMPPIGPASDPEQNLTDYAVQFKMFCFYSYGGEKRDEKHMEYILGQTPMNIPVIGQLTASSGAEAEAARTRLLRLFSRFGKYFVDGADAPNLSIHSGLRPKQRFQYEQKAAPAVALDANKRYIAFCLSGANSVSHYMNGRPNHWSFASRGTVPVGWAVPPVAADVLPNVTKFYYANATPNDCFVADLGGLGMGVPTVWGAGSNQPDQLLADYHKRSKEYLGYLDISTIWTAWLDDKALGNMADNLEGLKAVFYGSKGAGRYLDRASFMQGALPVIHTYVDTVGSAANLAKLPAALAKAKERFIFVGVDETGFGPQDDIVGGIAKTTGQLGDAFVVVRPDQLASLYAQAVQAKQVPAEAPKLAREEDEDGPKMTLKRVADGRIRVDGKIEDWNKVAPLRAYLTRDGRMATGAKRPAGAVADIAAVVDSRFLYVAAKVLDSEVIVDDVDLTAGDHIEVWVDGRRAPFREPLATQGFYRLALVPAAGLVETPQLVLQYPTYDVGLVSMNKHGIQEELSSVRTKDGYLIEAAIPLKNFPDCRWTPGDRVAIGFTVRDLNSRGSGETVTAAVDPLFCQPAIID